MKQKDKIDFYIHLQLECSYPWLTPVNFSDVFVGFSITKLNMFCQIPENPGYIKKKPLLEEHSS